MYHVPANHHADATQGGVKNADRPATMKIEPFKKSGVALAVGQDLPGRARQQESVVNSIVRPLDDAGTDPAPRLPAALFHPAGCCSPHWFGKIVEPGIVGKTRCQEFGQQDGRQLARVSRHQHEHGRYAQATER